MREKEPVVGSTDYGKDEDSAESLLKKHRALMSDLEAFKSTIEVLFFFWIFFMNFFVLCVHRLLLTYKSILRIYESRPVNANIKSSQEDSLEENVF